MGEVGVEVVEVGVEVVVVTGVTGWLLLTIVPRPLHRLTLTLPLTLPRRVMARGAMRLPRGGQTRLGRRSENCVLRCCAGRCS